MEPMAVFLQNIFLCVLQNKFGTSGGEVNGEKNWGELSI